MPYKNLQVRTAFHAAYYAEHAAHIKATASAYYLANAEHVKARQAAYNAANLDKVSATSARKRATKMKRTPDMYAVAAAWNSAGFDVHVDHEIPLRGRLVSGLHVLGNLSILPAKANMNKGNRYGPKS